MTNQTNCFREGRERPSRRLLFAVLLALMIAVGGQNTVSAHAEPERTSPPISGTVELVPAVVEIWFDEEVSSDGTTIQVIGPGGIQVDLSDATVDLQDPERKHVTVSLRTGLDAGVYTVQWKSLSSTDGDEAQGGYIFTVGSPASPAASAVASPISTATIATGITPETTTTPVATPATDDANFDSQGFFLSVAAGLGVAVLIFVFWRVVRPKNAKFRN